MKSLIFIVPLLLCQFRLILADESDPKLLPSNVFVEVQIVDLPREAALPLVRALLDKDKAEGAYTRIQELLDTGTAKLVGWPMLTMQSGERSVIEAIDEIRYASEYEPAAIAIYVTEDPGANGGLGKFQQTPKQPSAVDATEFNATPTAFETRNAGVTLEVEPTVSADEKTIELNIVPQHVSLKAMNKVTVEREKGGEKVVVEQPEFNILKSTTKLTVKSGERTLLGVYPAPAPPDHLELFILRAEVRRVQ